MVVLIDSGATHNFVSVQLVGPLGLNIKGNRETRVMMGNGRFEKSLGMCKGVVLTFPCYQLVSEFYPLELGSTDLILGIKWLRTVGDTYVNRKELIMTFIEVWCKITLKGEADL